MRLGLRSVDAPGGGMQESAVTSETRAGGPSWPLVARERPPPAAHRREDAWNTHGRRRVVGGWWDWERSSKIPESAECCCSIRSHSPAIIPLWEAVGSPFHSRPHHLTTVPSLEPPSSLPNMESGTARETGTPLAVTSEIQKYTVARTPEPRKSGDWLAPCGREDPGRRGPFSSTPRGLESTCVTQPPGG